MKQIHPTSRRFQWVSCLLLAVAVFLAATKPILAAETMMDMAFMETHQMDMSQIGEMSQPFETESQAMIRSDAASSGHTMICCLEGEESFFVANQTSLKPVKESGISARDEYAPCEDAAPLFSKKNSLPSGEITLLSSCQRE